MEEAAGSHPGEEAAGYHPSEEAAGCHPMEEAAAAVAAGTAAGAGAAARGEADSSIEAALRAAGWQASSPLEAAVEWMRFDFEYAARPSEASLLHNVCDEFTYDDFGPDSLLVHDRRGFDAVTLTLTLALALSRALLP